jgi:hypothetical protein
MRLPRLSLLGLLIWGCVSLSAHANTDLKADMDQLGTLLTQIYTNLNTPAQNAQSAAAAAQMSVIFTKALVLVPDSITALPAAQQAAALTTYKADIQSEIDNATALATAFQKNDNAGAQTIYTRMNVDKSAGHNQFKN